MARSPVSLPALLFASAALLGCADDDRPPPSPWSGASTPVPSDRGVDRAPSGDPAGCTPGAVQTCKVFLPKQGDVQSCFVGERVCDAEGAWGPCEEPVAPEGPWARHEAEVSHVAV
jgi:hypothetical protein